MCVLGIIGIASSSFFLLAIVMGLLFFKGSCSSNLIWTKVSIQWRVIGPNTHWVWVQINNQQQTINCIDDNDHDPVKIFTGYLKQLGIVEILHIYVMSSLQWFYSRLYLLYNITMLRWFNCKSHFLKCLFVFIIIIKTILYLKNRVGIETW